MACSVLMNPIEKVCRENCVFNRIASVWFPQKRQERLWMMCWLMILLHTFLRGCFGPTPFESIIHTYVEIRCLGPGRLEKTNRGYDMFYGQVKVRQESSSIKMKGCEWIWSISASAWLEVMKEEILKRFRFSQGECGWINLLISVTSWGIIPSLILWGKKSLMFNANI